MPSTRIKGTTLIFKLGGTDYYADATSVVLTNEESDSGEVVTFADAVTGTAVTYYLDVTAIQSTDTGSFWAFLWDNAGNSNVAFTFAPHGNTVATTTKPHFDGTVNLPAKPSVGGEANNTWTFDTRLTVNGTPAKRTTGST